MKTATMTTREKQLFNYMVDQNKNALNNIPHDCVAPLIAIRQTVIKTAEAIGNTELKTAEPLTQNEFVKITLHIYDCFFKN